MSYLEKADLLTLKVGVETRYKDLAHAIDFIVSTLKVTHKKAVRGTVKQKPQATVANPATVAIFIIRSKTRYPANPVLPNVLTIGVEDYELVSNRIFNQVHSISELKVLVRTKVLTAMTLENFSDKMKPVGYEI